jgi:hypothetical protein
MRALIHIGMPKAGSSSIQAFLSGNRVGLAAQGVRFAPFLENGGSQYELAAVGRLGANRKIDSAVARRVLRLHDRRSLKAFVRDYADWLDRRRRDWHEPLFVGSSEHIQAWLTDAAQIGALNGFLKKRFAEVRYVLYLRPQADSILSAYSERVRRGGTLSLAAHLEDAIPRHDYDAIVRLWHEAVGPEALDLRLLLPDALSGGDLLSDFASLIGVDRHGLITPERRNTALSAEQIAVRRVVNRVAPVRRATGAHSRTYAALVRLGEVLHRGETPLRWSDAQRAMIEQRFAASNEALRARCFPDRDRLF